jgi:hypothetical protein
MSKDNYSMWLLKLTADAKGSRRTGNGWFIGIIVALTLSALALFLLPRLSDSSDHTQPDAPQIDRDSAGSSIFTPAPQAVPRTDTGR